MMSRTPSSATANSMLPLMDGPAPLTMFPATRTTNRSPTPWSKTSSGDTRESAHPTMIGERAPAPPPAARSLPAFARGGRAARSRTACCPRAAGRAPRPGREPASDSRPRRRREAEPVPGGRQPGEPHELAAGRSDAVVSALVSPASTAVAESAVDMRHRTGRFSRDAHDASAPDGSASTVSVEVVVSLLRNACREPASQVVTRPAIVIRGSRITLPSTGRSEKGLSATGRLRNRAGTSARTCRRSSGSRPGGTGPGRRNRREARTCKS